jgi:hypothetical protein
VHADAAKADRTTAAQRHPGERRVAHRRSGGAACGAATKRWGLNFPWRLSGIHSLNL